VLVCKSLQCWAVQNHTFLYADLPLGCTFKFESKDSSVSAIYAHIFEIPIVK